MDTLGPYLLGPNDTEENGIYVGDARQLAELVPDESVDLIFTDPPYLREYLHLYAWLARDSARLLRPLAFLLTMCGGAYLNQIFAMMDSSLTFWWKYEIALTGAMSGCVWRYVGRPWPIATRVKSVLAYSKGAALPRTATVDLFHGTGDDKRYHAWGQDEASTRYYIDCFSARGNVVFDPFCGGGTTAAMAQQLGRQYLAFEIDPETAKRARERVRNTQPPLFVTEPEQLALVETA